jgi:hypothetical protein
VGIVSVNGFDFLAEDPNALFARTPGINGETVAGKWTKAVLERDELALIQSLINHASVHQFNDIATVDVGIVTGANEFFLVDNQTVEQYQLAIMPIRCLAAASIVRGFCTMQTSMRKTSVTACRLIFCILPTSSTRYR